jgi:hypothetical protein
MAMDHYLLEYDGMWVPGRVGRWYPNLGKFLTALEWKMLVYFMPISFNLRPFGIFSRFWYVAPIKIWQPWFSALFYTECEFPAGLPDSIQIWVIFWLPWNGKCWSIWRPFLTFFVKLVYFPVFGTLHQ